MGKCTKKSIDIRRQRKPRKTSSSNILFVPFVPASLLTIRALLDGACPQLCSITSIYSPEVPEILKYTLLCFEVVLASFYRTMNAQVQDLLTQKHPVRTVLLAK